MITSTFISYCPNKDFDTDSIFSFLLPVMIKSYPWDANFLANAAPIPLVAPVMQAVFLSLEFIVRIFSFQRYGDAPKKMNISGYPVIIS